MVGFWRWALAAVLPAALTVFPAQQLGGEFVPPLDEGDLLYMPSALPGLFAGKAAELLQQTDALIESVPEVASAFVKAWRANIWALPIRDRVDVLVSSALAERLTGGRYLDVMIDRDRAARYGLNIADVQEVVASAIGGDNIGETVSGLRRFPINVRYPREYRDSVERLRELPIQTEMGAQIRLADVADVRISDGAPMLKSENARLSGWVYVDLAGRDLRSAVRDMQAEVAAKVKLPPGYSVSWSGQFEYLERATERLKVVVPFTLMIVFVLLYLTFRRFDESLLIMAALPFALVGGIWLLWLLGHNVSVASGVGFIALAGVAAEFGVIMLLYLKQAWEARVADGRATAGDLLDAIREGAVLRVRPKAMTVAVIFAGLLPIMVSHGTGSEVMQRIAAPMVGGMVTAPLLSMLVIPAVYLLLRRRGLGVGPLDAAHRHD